MSTENTSTRAQANLIRAAVQAKINYWEALKAVELKMGDGGDLTASQEGELCQSIDDLAASVDAAASISNANAIEVFDRSARA